jgi:hypothetical protein
MPTQIKPVHEVDAHVVRLSDGRWSGYVDHRVNGGRQPECEIHEAGHFDTEAEAFSAALDLAKKIEQSRQS